MHKGNLTDISWSVYSQISFFKVEILKSSGIIPYLIFQLVLYTLLHSVLKNRLFIYYII
jgi:hypothetical protein